MDYAQFAILLITFIGLFIWNRTESRADMRHMDNRLEENKKETKEIVNSIREESKIFQQELKSFQFAIMQEMKDFHGRLCAIEERKKMS